MGHKIGFCLGHTLIVDWYSFTQERSHDDLNTCIGGTGMGEVDPNEEAVMYLSSGWSELYGWNREGNFVDFEGNPDGLYVVQGTTDPVDDLVESNEMDNTAYTFIEVQGSDITVLERGYGKSPWDKRKVLADPGLLQMNADTHYLPFSDVT